MKNAIQCVLAAAMMAAVAVPCMAADSPWTGTWKQNQAKDKLGDTFTVTKKANGMYHISDGSPITYDYACDGKDYASFADRMQNCTGTDAAGYDFTFKLKGTVLGSEHQTLTDGGKTLMIEGKNIRPDGTTSTYETKYVKVSGPAGMYGTWKSVAAKSSSDATMEIMVSSGTMHMKDSAYRMSFDAKLDGTPATVTGPTIPPGAQVVVKAEGPLKVHYSDMLNGKTFNEGTQTVSADGRTLTAESWVPGKMADKTSVVYEKQ